MKRIKALLGSLLLPLAVFAQPFRPQTPPTDPSYEMKEISCESAGNKLYGEAFFPKAPGRHPAVILSHGYGGTHAGFYALADTLAKSGYVCYCYDFAGGSPRSQSEGRTEDMSIFTERQNLMDVLEMVRKWDSVDPDNIFLLGESQGGCVSAITAPYVADKINSILLIYPALCIPDDAFALYPTRADVPDTVRFMGMKIGRAYYERFYEGYDIYDEIAGYQGDVLIVHGTEDGLVKPEYSARASNVYDHCELHLIFKAGHGFWQPEHRALYHEYVMDFLKRHLKCSDPAPEAPSRPAGEDIVVLETTLGTIELRLYDTTPLHRYNFRELVKQGAFDSLLFHRVIPDFMIQGGDPDSKNAAPGVELGDGDKPYTIPAEFRLEEGIFHRRGVLAAAREGDNVNPAQRSSAMQFYIVWGRVYTEEGLDQMQARLDARTGGRVRLTSAMREVYSTVGGTPHLDGQYTVFGEVVSGLDVVDTIQHVSTDENNRPFEDVRILKAYLK